MNNEDVIKVLAEDKTFENETKNKGDNDLEVKIKILNKSRYTKAIINLKEIELTSDDIIKEVKDDNKKLAKQVEDLKGSKGYVIISVIMSIKYVILDSRKDRQICKVNFPLVLESPNASKNKKEKIDEMDFTIPSMLVS